MSPSRPGSNPARDSGRPAPASKPASSKHAASRAAGPAVGPAPARSTPIPGRSAGVKNVRGPRPPAHAPEPSRTPPILVRQMRGGVTESRHRGSIVEVGSDGLVRRVLGDPDTLVNLRSAAKPFTIVAFVEAGGVGSSTSRTPSSPSWPGRIPARTSTSGRYRPSSAGPPSRSSTLAVGRRVRLSTFLPRLAWLATARSPGRFDICAQVSTRRCCCSAG